MGRKLSVPRDVQTMILARLTDHGRRFKVYGVEEVVGRFRGTYLYIGYVEESVGLPVKPAPKKLCRLKYTGDPENWQFCIYESSGKRYDEKGEFPFGSGSIEQCFDAAASLYIAECFPDLSPDLPTDQELLEFEHGSGRYEGSVGWEMVDGRLLPAPRIVDYLIDRIAQKWRDRVEARPIQLNTSLQAALNKQPGEWVEAIHSTLHLGDATRKRDRVKAITAELPAPDFLEGVIQELPEASRRALQTVLRKGGWVKYCQLTRRFGTDEEDGWFWNEQLPSSTLGLLRLHGLLFVGIAAIGARQWKVGVIPKELRPPLTKICAELSGSANEVEAS